VELNCVLVLNVLLTISTDSLGCVVCWCAVASTTLGSVGTTWEALAQSGVDVLEVVQLPEGWDQESHHDNGLDDLGAGNTGLTLSVDPRTVQQLLKLNRQWCTVGLLTGGPVLWDWQLDELVLNFIALLNLEAVGAVETLQFLNVFLLLGILDI